ncbi:MAG: TolC family protein, partial [Caulobacteraceae bacterium]|nr:TolC family protein [Caulobacteraceae bacterium]
MGSFRRLLPVAAGCLAALGPAAAWAEPETLGDAIALAYQTNPTLQSQRAAQRAIDEEYVQAQSGLRPTVNASANVTYQNNQIGILGPTELTTSFGGLTLAQPVWTGGRAVSAMDAAHADILAGRETLRRIEIAILQAVVQAYVDVRRGQQQLAIAQDNVAVLERQVEETQARFKAGAVSRTDVSQAQARRAQGEAQLAQAQATLAISRAAYDAVVGQNPGDLAPEPPIAQLLP